MICDYHLHSEYSADAKVPVRNYLDRAISLGMKEVCITDHDDYDSRLPENTFVLDYDRYYADLHKIQQEYESRIRLNIGVEMGLLRHEAEHYSKSAVSHPFDFIIGSMHFIDGIDIYYPDYYENRTEREAYEYFFKRTLDRVKELDYFDVLGHLDVMVRYSPNRNQNFSYESYQEYIDPILKCLLEKGKGLECNMGGMYRGLGHPNPTEDILKRYRELGGEILTVGSDSHQPEHLGYGFDKVPELLKECGFRYYTIFRERKPVFLAL